MAGGINPFGFSVGVSPAPRSRRGAADIPSAPFGFAPPPSKVQQTLAILNEYNPLPAFERLMKSPMALGGPISEQDIADGLMVAGTVTGGSAAAPKPKNALNMGIRAFHGSPHDFDKFDMGKIGTGEGAQAYGHGLYFAENEAVGQGYRDALRRKGDKITFDGKPLERPRDFTEIQTKLENDEGDWRVYKAVEEITSRQGDLADRLADIRNWYRNQPEMLAAIDRAEKRISLDANPGRMYEVNINADPDTFLDWDKPLSEQPKNVQEALAKLDPELWHPSGSDYDPLELGQTAYMRAQTKRYSVMGPDGRFGPGGRTYDESLAMAGGDPKKVKTITDGAPSNRSEALKQAGIPGIKYLDAGSRAAGDGSRNYVVFDDRLIEIVRKYGIAGASAMLGYNILDGIDPAQADELKRIEGNQ